MRAVPIDRADNPCIGAVRDRVGKGVTDRHLVNHSSPALAGLGHGLGPNGLLRVVDPRPVDLLLGQVDFRGDLLRLGSPILFAPALDLARHIALRLAEVGEAEGSRVEAVKLRDGGVEGVEQRRALIARGIDVSEVTDMGGVKYAQFEDPDGNLWLLQQWPADGSKAPSFE